MTAQTIFFTLLNGFGMTLKIFFATLAFALPLGLIIAFGSMSRFAVLRWISKTFVWIIRGTPLMLQVMIVFFAPVLIFGPEYRFNVREMAVIIAFIINYAAYFSEIYRGGIQAIPKGQYEAGQVLGMTRIQVFFKVILLQVVKRIMPPMSNEITTLVKDTALARVIAAKEILWYAYEMANKGLVWPLFYSGIFYLVFNGILAIVFSFIEKKLSYFKV